jgi:hypothetical protein
MVSFMRMDKVVPDWIVTGVGGAGGGGRLGANGAVDAAVVDAAVDDIVVAGATLGVTVVAVEPGNVALLAGVSVTYGKPLKPPPPLLADWLFVFEVELVCCRLR